MATLTPTLTLSSSDATGDSLSLSVTDTLTTTIPAINTAQISIGTASATNILTTAQAAHTYVYLKNMDDTNYVSVKIDAGTVFGRLRAGEFMFFPLELSLGLELQANTGSCVVEYGYWTSGATS
jgi:hypothetical protein